MVIHHHILSQMLEMKEIQVRLRQFDDQIATHGSPYQETWDWSSIQCEWTLTMECPPLKFEKCFIAEQI